MALLRTDSPGDLDERRVPRLHLGREDATVGWTFAGTDLDIAIFARGCPAPQIVDLLCGVRMGLSVTLEKPERLSLPNAPAGAYRLAIDHLGTRDESISCQVTVTR